MDRLHELEVFIAVADAGSFAKAGARLRLSPPAVTRAVSALEDRLGARVFNRTTRSLTMTDVGQRFLEQARRVLADLDAAEKAAVGEATVPHGQLTLTASVTFGRSAMMPIVCAFLQHHPRVSVSMLLLDRIANLIEEGIDLGVRIGELPDSGLVAKKVGFVQRILVASPDYLARRGMLLNPADLRRHSIIAFTGLMPHREWRFVQGRRVASISFAPHLEVNDASAAIDGALIGEGVTIALSYMVAEKIREGALVQILEEFTPPAVPVHLVHSQSRIVSPKVRAFVDFAAPRLRQMLESVALPRRRGPASVGEP